MARTVLFGAPDGSWTQNNATTAAGNIYTASGNAIATHFDVRPVTPGSCKYGVFDMTSGTSMTSKVLGNDGYLLNADEWNPLELDTYQSIVDSNDYGLFYGGDTNGVRSNRSDGGASGIFMSGFTYASGIMSSYTGLSTIASYYAIRLSGYVPPTITSIDGDNAITATQTGVSLIGTDMVDISGNPTIELCNSSDYNTATVKVTQSNLTSITDTGFSFDVESTGLSDGTVYAFITTALGQRNISFPVTLSGVSTVPEITGDMSVSSQNISGAVDSVPSLSGDIDISAQTVDGTVEASVETPELTGEMSVSSQSISGSILAVASLTGDIDISQQNVDGVVLSVPSIFGDSELSSQIANGEFVSVPSIIGNAEISRQNTDGALLAVPSVVGNIELSSQTLAGLIEAVSVVPTITGVLSITSQNVDGNASSLPVFGGSLSITGQDADGNILSVPDMSGNLSVSSQSVSGSTESIPSLSGSMSVSGQAIDGTVDVSILIPTLSGIMNVSSQNIDGHATSVIIISGDILVTAQTIDGKISVVFDGKTTTELIRLSTNDRMVRAYSSGKEPKEV